MNVMNGFLFRILLLCVIMFVNCTSGLQRKRNSYDQEGIHIHVSCSEFEESFYYPTPFSEKKDLLQVFAELSQKENPSMRFISTNRTEEIMTINGASNSWKEGWVIYVNGEKISPVDLKLGVRVGKEDRIEIKLEKVERIFGQPSENAN
ncbi:hypothetical protein [Leptospira idonii]|nr:hypothetical protein [Leptospira idonii]